MDIIDYGVCRLSVIPVRKDPAETAEQVTQLLFGDHYEVLELFKDQWVRIVIHFDQYTGWININQHQSISREYFNHVNDADFKITTDVTASLLYNKSRLAILLGSIIPISSTELFKMEEQFAFNGEAKNLGQKREFEFLKSIANKYLNSPYLWGGKSPFGIDCSGFTQMVFKIAGYRLFRDAWQQASQGKSIKSHADARPGDLAFFSNTDDKITHTGIVLSADRIIHASGKVRVDTLTAKGIVNSDTRKQSHPLSHLRRILAE